MNQIKIWIPNQKSLNLLFPLKKRRFPLSLVLGSLYTFWMVKMLNFTLYCYGCSCSPNWSVFRTCMMLLKSYPSPAVSWWFFFSTSMFGLRTFSSSIFKLLTLTSSSDASKEGSSFSSMLLSVIPESSDLVVDCEYSYSASSTTSSSGTFFGFC